MKKVLSVILSVLMLVALMPITAYAENGPSTAYEMWDDEEKHYFAYVYVTEPDENGKYVAEWGYPVGRNYAIFADNKTDNNAYAGVTYNRETNELTLDNGVKNCRITAFLMGDDFTIRVDGRASVDQIIVSSGTYGGNLDIKGNGELTVNKAKKFENAIVMNSNECDSKLRFGPDVKVELYASEDGAVVVTKNSSNSDLSQAYVFENGMTVEANQKPYSYETTENINAVYLSDPEDERWAGYIYENKNDPDAVYVGSTETDNETGETLYTLGRFVSVPKYDAFIRDYSFGDRYANGYEYVFTEEQWNAQTDYTPVISSTEEFEEVAYYDEDDLDAEGYYVASRLQCSFDPDGMYGFNEYSERVNGELTFEGIRISRFVLAQGTDKYIQDKDFEEIYMTWDEFNESDEWDVVYGTEHISLRWTGLVISSDDTPIYTDGKGNNYFVDFEGNVYTYEEEGVMIGDTFYHYTDRVEDVNRDDLEEVFKEVVVDGAYNYSIPQTELFYNTDGSHTHDWGNAKVTKKAGFGTAGEITHTCSGCAEVQKDTFAAVAAPKLSSTSYTYNGKAKKPSVVVKDKAGKVLKNGTDYSVAYKNNRNAGSATATVTLKGNYTGSKTLTFTIKKANQAMTAKGSTKTLHYESLKKKSAVIKNAIKVDNTKGTVTYVKTRTVSSKITVNKKTGSITVAKGLKKGTYQMTVKVSAAGSSNYKSVSKTVIVTIKVR